MLRLRVKIERIDGLRSLDTIAIANSGFVGLEPEVLLPYSYARKLELDSIVNPEIHTKVSGDGREVEFLRYRGAVKVYIITEDRVEGPITSSVLVSPRAKYVLLNDKLLGMFRVVLLDFGEGIWCFRDELGRKERRSY